MDPRAAQQAKKAQSLHDVMQAAQDWFVSELNGVDGSGARDYLSRRGIKAETQRVFGFGFAPDSRGRLRTALKSHTDPRLIEAGLLIDPDANEPEKRQGQEARSL